MKKNLPFVVLIFILLAATGCKKCYYCQNSCSQCQDNHFSILVQSDVFGANYYKLYIDSLQAVGWSCRDTTANKGMQVCAESSHTLNSDISLSQSQGYTCTPVAN